MHRQFLMILAAVLALGVAAGGVAQGTLPALPFDQVLFTLADNTSGRLTHHVGDGIIRDIIGSNGMNSFGGTGHMPCTHLEYFGHPLLSVIWDVQTFSSPQAGLSRPYCTVALYPKPADFEGRWPLALNVPAGTYHVVTTKRAEGQEVVVVPGTESAYQVYLYLASTDDPDLIPVPFRKPDWGIAPGALLQGTETVPYLTQIKRGCVYGVGIVLEQEILALDLVR